jgi:hypothetical protein
VCIGALNGTEYFRFLGPVFSLPFTIRSELLPVGKLFGFKSNKIAIIKHAKLMEKPQL